MHWPCLLLAVILICPGLGLAGPDMAEIPPGHYQPQYGGSAGPVALEAFLLDRYPVSNGDFLRFVAEHTKWQRSKIAPLFADETYLAHWTDDLVLGDLAPAAAPVTNVSWFAAKAYCEAHGKRLPSLNEWEYAAKAGLEAPEPRDPEAFDRLILDWYAKPTRLPLPDVGYSFQNYWGVWDMHGLIWEWVKDFNALVTTDGSPQDAEGPERRLFCAAESIDSADPSHPAAYMRSAMRGSVTAHHALRTMGFRCARDLRVAREIANQRQPNQADEYVY